MGPVAAQFIGIVGYKPGGTAKKKKFKETMEICLDEDEISSTRLALLATVPSQISKDEIAHLRRRHGEEGDSNRGKAMLRVIKKYEDYHLNKARILWRKIKPGVKPEADEKKQKYDGLAENKKSGGEKSGEEGEENSGNDGHVRKRVYFRTGDSWCSELVDFEFPSRESLALHTRTDDACGAVRSFSMRRRLATAVGLTFRKPKVVIHASETHRRIVQLYGKEVKSKKSTCRQHDDLEGLRSAVGSSSLALREDTSQGKRPFAGVSLRKGVTALSDSSGVQLRFQFKVERGPRGVAGWTLVYTARRRVGKAETRKVIELNEEWGDLREKMIGYLEKSEFSKVINDENFSFLDTRTLVVGCRAGLFGNRLCTIIRASPEFASFMQSLRGASASGSLL